MAETEPSPLHPLEKEEDPHKRLKVSLGSTTGLTISWKLPTAEPQDQPQCLPCIPIQAGITVSCLFSCSRPVCSLGGHMAGRCPDVAQFCISFLWAVITGILSQSSWDHLHKTIMRSSLLTFLCEGKVGVRWEWWSPERLMTFRRSSGGSSVPGVI